jgi:flagellar assembly protein FliH
VATKVLSGADTARATTFDWRPVHVAADSTHPVPLFGAPPSSRTGQAGDSGASGETDAEGQQRISEAYNRGVADGRRAAAEESAGLEEARMTDLARVVEGLAGYRSRLRHEAEHDLVHLALTIARRVIRRELSVDPEALRSLVRGALERLDAREIQKVRLHPEQAESVRRMLSAAAPGTEVVADTSLAPDEVLFESARGSLDAGVETQLAEIERGLTDLLPR